jgi:arylsulfatase A-like enzyme
MIRLSVVLMGLSLLSTTAVAQTPARPHIVFVLADDMGMGDAGCYGGTLVPTPNIDRLAADGTRFGL